MKNKRINKIVSLVLTFTLLLSLFCIDSFRITAQNAIQVWDGSTAKPSGEGTKESPFIISNGQELAFIISTGGGAGNHYKLTADIYLNEIDKVNWSTGQGIGGYTPRPWFDSVEFQGNIDGDGHVVYGIYYNAGLTTDEMVEGWSTPVGLIPCIKNGANVTIEKLGVDNMYINAKCTASAFIGRAGNSSATTEASKTIITIDSCFVGENVDVTAFCAGVFRGYSRNNAIYITNSYNLGLFRSNCDKKNNIDSGTYDYRFSWFVGNNWGIGENLLIKGCYNATGTFFRGHFATVKPLVSNCYAAGLTHDKDGDGVAEEVWYSEAGNAPLPSDSMKGQDSLVNALKMPKLNADGAYIATDSFPVLKAFVKDLQADVTEIPDANVWDGSIANELQGEGSKESPYFISNGAELALAVSSGGQNKFYKLTNNIYLNYINKINWKTGSSSDGYVPNTWFDNISFSGTIDGNGYVVYGLYFNNEAETSAWGFYGAGLVPRVNAGANLKITSLGIENAYVCGVNGVSAFVGFTGEKEATAKANITIDKCFVGKNVTLKGHDVGAFRGGTYNSVTTLTNSYSLAALVGTSTNGLIGNIWESQLFAENVFNANGAVTSENYSYNDVAKNLNNVYATNAGNYTGEVTVLTAEQINGVSAAENMSLPTDIFISVENNVPAIKDFFKYRETKNGENFIGYEYSKYGKYFTTENAQKRFWRFDNIDANGDTNTNICDLVYVTRKYKDGKSSINVDSDSETTTLDITILRKSLIGDTDYDEKPKRFTPGNSNISDKYEYVWGDEFEGNCLNADKWSFYKKMGDSRPAGFYCDKDDKVISVADGSLKLTAYKADDGTYHVPISVLTRDTMNFRYGYVEIRAKLPLQTGVWSSFWALTVSDSATIGRLAIPKCQNVAEIDIFEVFNTNQVCGTIIKWADKSWYPKSPSGSQRVTLTDSDNFHIFGYEWTPTELKYYCDGVLYARFDVTEPWVTPGEEGKGKEGWTYYNVDETGYDMSCFSDPQYLLFNNHLFYEGVSDANKPINETNPNFKQADYLIDYCRVYQLSGQELYTK